VVKKREELATPLGQLSDSQMVDVRWAGEDAAFLCWMLKLTGELSETTPADPSTLPTFCSVLKPEAVQIISSASLRDQSEIEAICCQSVLILSMLRESRIGPPASEIIRRTHIEELNGAGLSVSEEDLARATGVFGRMTPQERAQVAGLYAHRHHVALWYLSDRARYFEPVED
jgi:hypothetical protein